MFRRKQKNKNSFLGLYSLNRGSDIVRPENSSLIVNESELEVDNVPKELTSVLSEDEDVDLELVMNRNSSSFMKSVSQKSQSTPLTQACSQSKIFKKIENSCRQIPKPGVCRLFNKFTLLSGQENISYFEEILKAEGVVPLPGNSSFLISEDHAVLSVKIHNKLKQSHEKLKKFVDSLKEMIKDNESLQKMLAHTLTAENCEVARGPVQEPLIRILLNVECIQVDVVELLLEAIANLVVDNNMEVGNVQLISSILRQMRFLSKSKDLKIASKLFEIIHVAAVNIQKEIIFMFPEIISEGEVEETCNQLMNMLKFDDSLTSVIVDAMANLPLNQALKSQVCSKILQRLDKCPLEFLPSLVQFVLTNCHTEDLQKVVNGLRNGLPFTPEHYKLKKSETVGEKRSLEEDCYIKLTFENLKFSAMSSKEITDAWIKVILNLDSFTDFRCIDMIMLIIFYCCLFGRKAQILQLTRSKIKSSVLTQIQVRDMFKILIAIAEEYYSSILEMASAFFKSFDSKISNFGALLYKECFIHFQPFMKQIVISEILILVGTGPPAVVKTALCTLKDLCENETEALSQHITSVMGLLVKIQDLELSHVRLLIDVIASLVVFDSSGRETAAQDELLMFIRKQLISSKLEQCKKGVSAAVMFAKHYGKDNVSDDHNWTQINSLMDLAMDLNGMSETKRGFFNDEFATMVMESQLKKSFLEVWSEKTYDLLMENIFVKNIDVKFYGFPVSLQYGLHEEDVQKLVFHTVNSALNIPVPAIPSTLRLLWCLEKNVNKILPVFLASIVMPEATVYENFNSFDDSEKRRILNCLFLCGNYLIESINALCANGILDKAVLRVKQLVNIRKMLSKLIGLFPEFVPPICQFYSSPQSKNIKMKNSEKKAKRGQKRKLDEIGGETLNSSLESLHSPGTAPACIGEDSLKEADLHQYFAFFREIDFVSFKLLATDSESSTDPESLGPNLETSDFLFLLEDMLCKAEQILKTSEVTSCFKNKSVVLPMRKMRPEDFILASVKLMPWLLNKIEVFSKYCENLLESNDWIYDSRGLYVHGACQIKLAMATGIKFIAVISSWQGFQNNELLTDFLLTFARKRNSNRVSLSLDSVVGLAFDAANYLATFKKTIMVLSGGLSIVKFFQACLRFSSFSDSCSVLADLCHEFLCRHWFTVTGVPEKGPVYNQHVDFLLKTYFYFVENKLGMVHLTAKTVLDEMGGLAGKDSTLKTFKTIRKSNFSLLFRIVCEALTSASANEFSKTNCDKERQLDLWNKIVETLMILVEIAKIHSSRVILASLLKRSQSILQLFLTKGMPLVECALRVKSVEVLTLLKSFQVVTRFLHSVCCHSRITNDSVLATHVPVIRSQCERLTLEVKGMLILNGLPMECITIAILKNRDIKGNDIISQKEYEDKGAPNSSRKTVEFPSRSELPEELPERAKLCCSTRLMFSMVCFVAIFSVTYVRIGISMALVCMAIPEGKNVDLTEKRGEFTWSSNTKGYLISAVFYGFVAGPFLAGFLSFKIGGRIILMIGTIGTGVTNFLAPEAARVSPILFFVVRVMTGFFASFTFPAFYDLVTHWIVPTERQLLVTGALVGIPAANILNFPVTSGMCIQFGWVWIFYSIAIWMVLSGIIYFFVVFDYPENCPFISEKELRFLKSRIPNVENRKIPWKKIVKSLPIYAYFITHFCISYVYLTMVFSLPLLMKSVHHFPLQENGFLSATPFVGSFTVRILTSLFFEQLRVKLKLSKNALRKIFVFTGSILVSLFFLIITFLSCSYRYWVLGCFIMASSSLELCLSGGYLLSLLDLCPSYVNILTGIANSVGNSAGLISPVVTGLITPHGTREEWNAVFYVNISIILGSMIFYIVFGQNDLQYWGLATLPSKAPVPRASLVS